MSVVGFLHTSPVHVPTFERLVDELAPNAEIRTVVDEALLARAREVGPDDAAVRRGVATGIERLVADGADVIVCTCSTVGDVAEVVGAELGLRVVRVDRPMAERAVAIGGRVLVLAAVESTLGPTRELLDAIAMERKATIEIDVRIVEGAWALFEAGNVDAYLDAITVAMSREAAVRDVIVLAQASMAAAADRVDVGVPVLSSPRLAVASALA